MSHTTTPWGRLTRLTLGGGLAFWVVNGAISLTPIAAVYRAGLSIPYWPMTVAALVGGLILAGCISLLLLRFEDRLPGSLPLGKALILSLAALALIEAFSLVVDAGRLSIVHLIGAGLNVPRFLALGAAIGWLYGPNTSLQRAAADGNAGATR